MAFLNALLGTLLATAAIDIVGVYTSDFRQVFPDARPVKGTIKELSKLMEHPLETGAPITDHRIILPIEIELSLLLSNENYRNVYESIRQFYLNGTILSVHTRAAVYQNQIIYEIPHEEDPEMYETLLVALKLREAQFFTASTAKNAKIAPKNPRNSSTVDRGNQQTQPVSTQKSVAYGLLFK